MVEYSRNFFMEGGNMSFLGISQGLQRELAQTFNEETCNVLIKLVEEIYNTSDIRFHKIFEEKQEFLVLSISERLREVFATKSELTTSIDKLRLEIQAEFAKIRQEMAKMKQELKEDISNVKLKLKQEIAEVKLELSDVKSDFKVLRKEVRFFGIGLAALIILLQPVVFEFISKLFGK